MDSGLVCHLLMTKTTEFATIIESMGGLDGRINIPAADIALPAEP
jgi:hypothetical protein